MGVGACVTCTEAKGTQASHRKPKDDTPARSSNFEILEVWYLTSPSSAGEGRTGRPHTDVVNQKQQKSIMQWRHKARTRRPRKATATKDHGSHIQKMSMAKGGRKTKTMSMSMDISTTTQAHGVQSTHSPIHANSPHGTHLATRPS